MHFLNKTLSRNSRDKETLSILRAFRHMHQLFIAWRCMVRQIWINPPLKKRRKQNYVRVRFFESSKPDPDPIQLSPAAMYTKTVQFHRSSNNFFSQAHIFHLLAFRHVRNAEIQARNNTRQKISLLAFLHTSPKIMKNCKFRNPTRYIVMRQSYYAKCRTMTIYFLSWHLHALTSFWDEWFCGEYQ